MEANGTSVCTGGVCAVGTCSSGYMDCNMSATDGCETHVAADPANCGSCHNVCNEANATATCRNGSCAVGMCNPGAADCDGNASNGCETNTETSITACGGCRMPCVVENNTPVCTNGSCGVGTCNSGFADCNNLASDGCEVNLHTDSNNCGHCGTKCGSGTECSGGTCQNCPAGTAWCNNTCLGTQSDPENCGGCGRRCGAGQICSRGQCGACGSDSDCSGNPNGGVCVYGQCQSGCGSDSDCSADGINSSCYAPNDGPGFCFEPCQSDSDCSPGFVCALATTTTQGIAGLWTKYYYCLADCQFSDGPSCSSDTIDGWGGSCSCASNGQCLDGISDQCFVSDVNYIR
jgi:hypothetical protein